MTGKVSTDVKADEVKSQFMLNKSNPSLLRRDMSEKKDIIHSSTCHKALQRKNLNSGIILNYNTLNFCQSIPHTDMLHNTAAAAAIISCLWNTAAPVQVEILIS